MPIIRRALTVAAVTAAGTLAFALPASAHTADFARDCGHVTLTLNDDFPAGTYTIDVFRDGTQFDEFTYTVDQDTKTHTYDESNDGTFTYHITWQNQKQYSRDHGTTKDETPPAPTNCDEQPPPATPTDTPPATPPAKPVSAPTTSAPAVAPTATPSKAVEADKLANTGAGNTVPLVVVGAVLVAGGVGLTFVTRRRRSGSTSS